MRLMRVEQHDVEELGVGVGCREGREGYDETRIGSREWRVQVELKSG